MRLRFTSKAGVRFLVRPINERGADRGTDVCAREQTIVSQATPFAVRVWIARLGTAVSGEVKRYLHNVRAESP